MNRVAILCAVSLCALSHQVFAEDVTDSTVTVQSPTDGLTAADQSSIQAMIDQVRAEHLVIFPDGNVNTDLYKQVEGERVKDNLEWLEQYQRFSGSNPNVQAADIDIGGGFTITGRTIQSPRHMRDTRFLGAGGQLQIISANENILDDQNHRLNQIANRLEKSKFACGHFDWVMQLKTKFNLAALRKYTDSLADSALAAAPMALLANLSPTLYEIIKWLRMNASMDLNADKAKCENLEQAFTDAGRRMTRGDGYAACMKANSRIDISDAHRICNSGDPSPFDGVENMAGNIVGLNATNPNINLTQQLSDRMRPAKGPASAAAEKNLADASASLARANAALVASPDPGAKPNRPDGSTEMIAWQAAAAKHEAAKANYDRAAENVRAATEIVDNNGEDAGFWNSLRSNIADNLGNIIGDIDLSAKSDLQFGRQRQYQLILKYKFQAYKLSLEFCTQLENHYALLVRAVRPRGDLADSYTHLQAFAFSTFKCPWLDWRPVYVLDDKTTSPHVRFGYDTLDKLSVLWTMYKNGGENSLARTVWADQYRTVETINVISTYEMYNYLWEHAQRDKDTVLQQVQSSMKGPAGDRIYQAVASSMDEYSALLERKRSEQLPILVQCVHAVNQFRLTPGATSVQGNAPALPALQRNELGR